MNGEACCHETPDAEDLDARVCRDLGWDCQAPVARPGGSVEFDLDRLRWQ